MSSKNGLRKLYDRLTPEERFKLDVEAMARGDAEESRRLVESCPRRGYTMTDLRFSGRWDGALQIAMGTLMDLGHNITKLRMIDALRVALPYCRTLAQNDAAGAYFEGHEAGSRYAWSKAGMEGESPGYEANEEQAEDNADPQMEEDLDEIEAGVNVSASLIPGLLERLERQLATEALAVWEAFSGFCAEEMELSAEKLLQATFTPALEDVSWFKEVCERFELEVEPSAVEEYRHAMSAHWQHLLERG